MSKRKSTRRPRPSPAVLRVDARFLTAGERDRLRAEDPALLAPVNPTTHAIQDTILARAMSEPAVRSAVTIQPFDSNLDLNALVDELQVQVAQVRAGDMQRPEAMLVAQAHTLDALFTYLARRAHANMGTYPETADRYLRLAFRAQAQTVRTIEALGELKNPRPVAFVKQANIAHNQQVNTGAAVAPRAQASGNRPNELLEHTHGNPLDRGAAATAGRADSDLAALAARDWPADG